MFTDLVGSTALASRLDPEDWHEILDAYQHRVAAVIGAHGGVVTQFQGDGVVAYFGFPEALDSAGRDALAAGLAIVAEVPAVADDVAPGLGVGRLAARVGVHTGVVVVAEATAGGVGRLADVFGEAPNLAARLQAVAGSGQVVVSEATASMVKGFFDLEPLGGLDLKGIALPVVAYRVVAASGARHRLDAVPLAPFVERPAATAWLEAQWQAALSGGARVVVVGGEAGIGKSRLVVEFSRALDKAGHPTLACYCSRRERLSPLQPFGQVIGTAPRTPADAADWVTRWATGGPALLVVEDVHWADPSTMEAVHLIAAAPIPLLVVITSRPEGTSESAGITAGDVADRIFVARLSPEESEGLIDVLDPQGDLSGSMRSALVVRGGGVPLFIEELARSMADDARHSAAPTPGGPSVVPGPSGLLPAGRAQRGISPAMPVTLFDVVASRLDRLGDAKRVAQLAAVIGRSFDQATLGVVTGLGPVALGEQLARLVDHGIVEPGDSPSRPMWFRHALIAEAAYGSLLRRDRRPAHGLVADALLAAGAGDERPQVVAAHLGQADRPAEAVAYWRRAAQAARHNSRFLESASHEQEVLALLPRLPLASQDLVELEARSRLAMCMTAVDQRAPEVLPQLRRVQDLARRHGALTELVHSYQVLVPWCQANADYAGAENALVEARASATALGDPTARSMVDQLQGPIRIWQGRFAEGVDLIESALDSIGLSLAAELTELPEMSAPAVIARCSVHGVAALAAWIMGRFDDFTRLRQAVLAFADQRAVPQAQALTWATAAIAAQLDGDRARVSALAARTRSLADDVTTRQWREWSAALIRWAEPGPSGEGRLRQPDAFLRPYFQMLEADHPSMATVDAAAMLDEALGTARTTGERFCEAELLRGRALALAGSGDHPGARDALRHAASVAADQGAAALELRALTSLAALDGPGTRSTAARTSLAACAARLEHAAGLVRPRCLDAAARVLAGLSPEIGGG